MPGTSAGMRKAWATRRAKYGPSGRAGGANTATSSSENRSRTSKSSKNTNRSKRDVRSVNGERLPYDRSLELWGGEREEVLKSIRAIDRAISSNPKHLPPYVLQVYRESRDKLTRRLRELDDSIARRQDDVLRQDRKKHGRRYNT